MAQGGDGGHSSSWQQRFRFRRRKIVRRLHLDRKAETVEKLRSQLALFGITGPHQHDPRGMTNAEPVAFDHVFARCESK
jgi:hypothetical protein